MSKLVRKLRMAHAIEIGAQNAYEGHWRNLDKSDPNRLAVWWIQKEEILHQDNVRDMLKELGAKPNPVLDSILWLIGKTISAGCYVFGHRMTMWGAKIMEKMGAYTYKELAIEARDAGYPAMGVELDYMQRAEEDHERFFQSVLSR